MTDGIDKAAIEDHERQKLIVDLFEQSQTLHRITNIQIKRLTERVERLEKERGDEL